MRALLLKTARAKAELASPYKDALIALDPRWGDPELGGSCMRNTDATTPLFLLRALDLSLAPDGHVVHAPAEDVSVPGALRPHVRDQLLGDGAVRAARLPRCLHAVARCRSAGPTSRMALVLVPFWTSILVRTTAWFILLQREGPVNALLQCAARRRRAASR